MSIYVDALNAAGETVNVRSLNSANSAYELVIGEDFNSKIHTGDYTSEKKPYYYADIHGTKVQTTTIERLLEVSCKIHISKLVVANKTFAVTHNLHKL